MSWVTTVLKDIGKGALKVVGVLSSPTAQKIESAIPIVAGFATMINPALGAAAAIGSKVVNMIEGAVDIEKAGVLKHQTASQIIVAEIQHAEEFTSQFGLGFDVPPDELKAAIDATVANWNAWDALVKKIAANHAAKAPAVAPAVKPA